MQKFNYLSLNMAVLSLLSSGQVSLMSKYFQKFVDKLEKHNTDKTNAIAAEDAIEILIE